MLIKGCYVGKYSLNEVIPSIKKAKWISQSNMPHLGLLIHVSLVGFQISPTVPLTVPYKDSEES